MPVWEAPVDVEEAAAAAGDDEEGGSSKAGAGAKRKGPAVAKGGKKAKGK
jgi:hypothetical protein